MKVIDLLGNEIKAGDFVVFASDSQLRRGVIKEINNLGKLREIQDSMEITQIKLKSIILEYQHVLQGQIEKRKNEKNGEFCFDVIRLGSFEQAFNEEERNKISSSRIKIKFG